MTRKNMFTAITVPLRHLKLLPLLRCCHEIHGSLAHFMAMEESCVAQMMGRGCHFLSSVILAFEWSRPMAHCMPDEQQTRCAAVATLGRRSPCHLPSSTY